MTTTETGFNPDFEAYVLEKARQLLAAGATEEAAVRESIIWTRDLYEELAQGVTARAIAFRRDVIAQIHASIRNDSTTTEDAAMRRKGD